MDGHDRKRLARQVIARRVELGMFTTKALADAAQLSPRMLGDVENGRRDNYSSGAKAQIERALRWDAGSVDAVLAGGEPTLTAESPDSVVGLHVTPKIEMNVGPVSTLHWATILWRSVRELADSGLEVVGDAEIHRRARQAIVATTDVLTDLLLASPDAANSRDLLAEMFAAVARVRDDARLTSNDVDADTSAQVTNADFLGAGLDMEQDDEASPELVAAARKLKPGEHRAQPEHGVAGGEESQIDLSNDN